MQLSGLGGEIFPDWGTSLKQKNIYIVFFSYEMGVYPPKIITKEIVLCCSAIKCVFLFQNNPKDLGPSCKMSDLDF